jgi:hypothetical protein
LLAADSLGVVKIQKHGFAALSGVVLGFGQVVEPTYLHSHKRISFLILEIPENLGIGLNIIILKPLASRERGFTLGKGVLVPKLHQPPILRGGCPGDWNIGKSMVYY